MLKVVIEKNNTQKKTYIEDLVSFTYNVALRTEGILQNALPLVNARIVLHTEVEQDNFLKTVAKGDTVSIMPLEADSLGELEYIAYTFKVEEITRLPSTGKVEISLAVPLFEQEKLEYRDILLQDTASSLIEKYGLDSIYIEGIEGLFNAWIGAESKEDIVMASAWSSPRDVLCEKVVPLPYSSHIVNDRQRSGYRMGDLQDYKVGAQSIIDFNIVSAQPPITHLQSYGGATRKKVPSFSPHSFRNGFIWPESPWYLERFLMLFTLREEGRSHQAVKLEKNYVEVGSSSETEIFWSDGKVTKVVLFTDGGQAGGILTPDHYLYTKPVQGQTGRWSLYVANRHKSKLNAKEILTGNQTFTYILRAEGVTKSEATVVTDTEGKKYSIWWAGSIRPISQMELTYGAEEVPITSGMLVGIVYRWEDEEISLLTVPEGEFTLCNYVASGLKDNLAGALYSSSDGSQGFNMRTFIAEDFTFSTPTMSAVMYDRAFLDLNNVFYTPRRGYIIHAIYSPDKYFSDKGIVVYAYKKALESQGDSRRLCSSYYLVDTGGTPSSPILLNKEGAEEIVPLSMEIENGQVIPTLLDIDYQGNWFKRRGEEVLDRGSVWSWYNDKMPDYIVRADNALVSVYIEGGQYYRMEAVLGREIAYTTEAGKGEPFRFIVDRSAQYNLLDLPFKRGPIDTERHTPLTIHGRIELNIAGFTLLDSSLLPTGCPEEWLTAYLNILPLASKVRIFHSPLDQSKYWDVVVTASALEFDGKVTNRITGIIVRIS